MLCLRKPISDGRLWLSTRHFIAVYTRQYLHEVTQLLTRQPEVGSGHKTIATEMSSTDDKATPSMTSLSTVRHWLKHSMPSWLSEYSNYTTDTENRLKEGIMSGYKCNTPTTSIHKPAILSVHMADWPTLQLSAFQIVKNPLVWIY